ncbi:MAG TPA: competence/damage-inducible protein A [Terriglobales bacterium]|nr:competence/damage-inducible protein A [Terriglobales bacterium]
MDAEVIAVGSELFGPVADTNSVFLTRELTAIGIRVIRKLVVPDDLAVLAATLRECCQRSPLVVCTGGLGPTEDDRTRFAAAQALDAELVLDSSAAALLQDRFARRQRPMPENILRQAFRLPKAEWLANAVGTAAGQWVPTPTGILALLPGPPRELQLMFANQVRPRLCVLLPKRALFTRALSIVGVSESAVDALAAPIYRRHANPITTILSTTAPSVELHFQASAPTAAEAQDMADRLAAEVERHFKTAVFSRDGETMAAVVGRLLRARRQRLAVAESCTGGLLSERLTDAHGASDFFVGGVVCYSNSVKQAVLGVRAATLANQGAVSSHAVQELAQGVRLLLAADWGLAITGIAGPAGGSAAKPVGTVFIALECADGAPQVQQLLLFGDRDQIRRASAQCALDMLRRRILADAAVEE